MTYDHASQRDRSPCLFAPKARVIHAPSSGPERRGLVVSKVNDVDAYVVRLGTGQRITVPANEIRQNKYR